MAKIRKKWPFTIPPEILEDEKLNWTEKALFTEIIKLAKRSRFNNEPCCYALDDYLIERLHIPRRTLTRTIARLCKNGYLRKEPYGIYKGTGRRLFPLKHLALLKRVAIMAIG